MNPIQKTHCLTVFALVLLFALAAPVVGEETRGNIAWIEPADHTFTLVDDNNNVLEMRFLVSGDLSINDQDATFWDLLPGDYVAVTFDREYGEMIATAIECRRAD